jgi:hypothetical protein
MKKQLIAGLSVVLIVLTCSISTLHAQKQFTFEDVMKFEELRQPVVSANGTWIAYGVWPERGDGEVRVQQVSGNRIHTIARGERPQLSRNGDFAAAIVQPPFLVQENASRNDRPRTSLALLNTRTGDQTSFDEVQRFAFAANGQTLIIHHHQPKSLDAAAKKNEHLGRPITLVALPSGETKTIGFVNESAIDSTGRYFVYAVSDTLTSNNGLYSIDLQGGLSDANAVLTHDLAHISNLSWDDSRLRLAFTATILDTADAFRPSDAHIATWAVNGGSAVDTLVGPAHVSSEFRLRAENRLVWTRDGARLFYAVRSAEMVELEENKSKRDSLTAENMFNLDYILEDIRGDVWHSFHANRAGILARSPRFFEKPIPRSRRKSGKYCDYLSEYDAGRRKSFHPFQTRCRHCVGRKSHILCRKYIHDCRRNPSDYATRESLAHRFATLDEFTLFADLFWVSSLGFAHFCTTFGIHHSFGRIYVRFRLQIQPVQCDCFAGSFGRRHRQWRAFVPSVA